MHLEIDALVFATLMKFKWPLRRLHLPGLWGLDSKQSFILLRILRVALFRKILGFEVARHIDLDGWLGAIFAGDDLFAGIQENGKSGRHGQRTLGIGTGSIFVSDHTSRGDRSAY